MIYALCVMNLTVGCLNTHWAFQDNYRWLQWGNAVFAGLNFGIAAHNIVGLLP
jgi:hypothetical protein